MGNQLTMSEELFQGAPDTPDHETQKEFPLPKRTKYRTTNPRDTLEIPMEPEGLGADEPTTVGKVFKETVSRIPDKPALRYKDGDTWNTITYREYYNLVIQAGKSFLKVGWCRVHVVSNDWSWQLSYSCHNLLSWPWHHFDVWIWHGSDHWLLLYMVEGSLILLPVINAAWSWGVPRCLHYWLQLTRVAHLQSRSDVCWVKKTNKAIYIICFASSFIILPTCFSYSGLAAGIYTTNGPEACHFVANDCEANVIVVENQKQLDKILEVT